MLQQLLRHYKFAIDSVQRANIIKLAAKYLTPTELKQFKLIVRQ